MFPYGGVTDGVKWGGVVRTAGRTAVWTNDTVEEKETPTFVDTYLRLKEKRMSETERKEGKKEGSVLLRRRYRRGEVRGTHVKQRSGRTWTILLKKKKRLLLWAHIFV